MSYQAQTDRITQGDHGPQLLPELVVKSLQASDPDEFLKSAIAHINSVTGAATTAVLQGVKGQWRTLGKTGNDICRLGSEGASLENSSKLPK